MQKFVNLICIVISSFWTAVCAWAATLGFLFYQPLGHAAQRIWGKGFLKLLGIKVTIEGLENIPRHHGFILAPNHQSNIDVMLLASLPIPFRWVAKSQVSKIPFIGTVLRTMGSYLVRRDQSGHDLNVMREVEEGLKSGNSVLIFPEGTRTRTGELLPFKKGAFRTAQNTGVPLLPIGIHGTRDIAPPGHVIPPRWGHHVRVRIGKPVTIPPHSDINQVMTQFRQTLLSLI